MESYIRRYLELKEITLNEEVDKEVADKARDEMDFIWVIRMTRKEKDDMRDGRYTLKCPKS